MSLLEDQGARQEPRSIDAIVLNPDNQPTKPDQMSTKIIKYSEITDNVDSENLNSDIVIEMHPLVSETISDTRISSSGLDNEARVSEISLDMPPNEVLDTIVGFSTVNPNENSDPAGPSRLSANRSD